MLLICQSIGHLCNDRSQLVSESGVLKGRWADGRNAYRQEKIVNLEQAKVPGVQGDNYVIYES